MNVFTNENNTATLKIIIASAISGKPVEIQKDSFDGDIFNGPRSLPLLQVDEDLSFFSSNAATLYLFPDSEGSRNGLSQQLPEWEATRLQPSVALVLSAKSVPGDLKQTLQGQLQYLDGLLKKNQFVNGNALSAVDVILWSTIYPLCNNDELSSTYLGDLQAVTRWYQDVASNKSVQSAVQKWGGCPKGPFASTSALGIPQNTNIGSPAGTPDEKVEGPTAKEVEEARENWLNGLSGAPTRQGIQKPVLPVEGRKNVLITSALPYVNNVPHLGNIIGCVLSADIFARYCRLCDYNTLFVCGTDEYGTATETKALEEGLTPQQLCDKYHAIHRDAYQWFDIDFDYFGRTTTPQQTEIAQRLFLKLHENGFISCHSVDQLLCEKCNRFLADRFVEGTCPHPGCGYPDARGDQCDGCGKLVTATELTQPRCKLCQAQPVIRTCQQLFLDLDQLEPPLLTWLHSNWQHWSSAARGSARGWLRESLKPRAVTRDLQWGVAVPLPNFTEKVFYVWFDAPIGYMSITQNAMNDYEKWWKPAKELDVTLYQFMAKDNVPFHSIMFPATLIGVNEGHLLVKHIFATEYLNYEDGKFSKSRGVGVFADSCRASGVASDVWRYYLAASRPETNDCSFSWAEFLTRNNSELLNNLGNFCHRSLSFCKAAFKGRVPETKPRDAELELVALINREYKAYIENMERGKLRESLRHVMVISRLGNQYMQSTQPWVLVKGGDEDKSQAATCIGLCCNVVYLLSLLLAPYTPAAADKLRAQLGVQYIHIGILPSHPYLIQYLPKDHVLGTPEPLFSKLDPEFVDKLRDQCSGSRNDKNNKTPSVKELELSIAIKADKIRQLKATTKDKSAWMPIVEEMNELKKMLVEVQGKKSGGSVGELEKEVAVQADKVRQLKASTKDKAAWQPEVDKLLALKKQLADAQKSAPVTSQPQSTDAKELEKMVAQQADKVRQLKSSTKDKAAWQPEVDKLLALKKQLADAQKSAPVTSQPQSTDAKQLEEMVAQQADKVRQLKASTKDKAAWQPEVDKLLALKKQLTEAQAANAPPSLNTNVAYLEKQVAEQADKVRKLKASTKDKAVWQPEVDKLLALKKQLADAQKAA